MLNAESNRSRQHTQSAFDQHNTPKGPIASNCCLRKQQTGAILVTKAPLSIHNCKQEAARLSFCMLNATHRSTKKLRSSTSQKPCSATDSDTQIARNLDTPWLARAACR